MLAPPSQRVFNLPFQPLKGTCPIFPFPRPQISAKLQICRVTNSLRVFFFYRDLPIHPRTQSYILPLAHFDAAILSLCVSGTFQHFLLSISLPHETLGQEETSLEAAVLLYACPGLGTRGSLAQGRVPGLSVRQTGKQSFQYHVFSATVRRYVHQAMVGGTGRALVKPELGLRARVEFCQREKADKCDRVRSCPPQTSL